MMSLVTATIAASIDTILPAFEEMEAAFGLDEANSPISLAITVFFASMGVGMLFWGPLSDRFGRKPTMWASFALFVLGAVISTLATSFAMFLVGRVVWGVAATGPRTVSLAITRDSYEGDTMARIMSLTTAVFLIVPILAPGVGELMLTLGSWRLTTAVGGVLGVVAALWIGRLEETLDPADQLPLEFGRFSRAAKAVITNRTTVLFTLAAVAGYGAFFPWLGSSVQMISEIYDRPSQFAWLFGGNAIGMAIMITISARMVDRHSTKPVLMSLLTALVVTSAVYTVVSLASDGRPTFWVWFALASLLTAFNSASTPLTQTLAMEPMGKIAGTASSVTGSVIFIGGALLGGLVDSLIDTSVTPFGVGFLLLSSIGLTLVALSGQR